MSGPLEGLCIILLQSPQMMVAKTRKLIVRMTQLQLRVSAKNREGDASLGGVNVTSVGFWAVLGGECYFPLT